MYKLLAIVPLKTLPSNSYILNPRGTNLYARIQKIAASYFTREGPPSFIYVGSIYLHLRDYISANLLYIC